MHIRITMDLALVSIEDLARLYSICNFGSYEELMKGNAILTIFKAPSTGIFAVDLDSGKILGAARILSDNLITSYIAEICVLPKYRGKGIADKIMEALTVRFNHTAIFTCGFVGMEDFLHNHGFSRKSKLFACSRRPNLERNKPCLFN